MSLIIIILLYFIPFHLINFTNNTIFVKMRQNAHFETTTTCKTSKIVVEAKLKHVL